MEIIPFIFIVTLSLGILYIYAIHPSPVVIVKYPVPNSESPLYLGEDNKCFKYSSKEVKCPADIK